MRGREAILAPIFSLQYSEYGDFLYAPIGEEKNGMVLTALSALARIELDPWQEAARLALLPTEVAKGRLASIISGLPNGCWARSDAGTIAARLIALLPAPKASQALSRGTTRGNRSLSYRVAVFAFFVVLNIAVFVVFRSHEPAPAIDDGNHATSTTNTPPDVPMFGSK
ncbi:MAG TPA: hypothetical protein VMU87_11900 [Stellaceae bacterium]|nr:hypothetical protein [Stellaceae bacterium]